MEEHPIDRLYRTGVSLNVNTDSRMLTPTTMTREYEALSRVFQWGEQEFLRTNLMGLEAAFADDGVKQQLKARLLDAYRETVPPSPAARMI
jgi:adenosine deaminase